MANRLSEKERLKIINLVNIYGRKWNFIATQMPGRSESTIKSFYNTYEEKETIFPKLGRPVKITAEVKEEVINSIEEDPEQHLTNLSFEHQISTTSVKKILNDDGYSYHQKTAVTPLRQEHVNARLGMCNRFLVYDYGQLWPIIFTDESTIIVNMNNGGIWRKRGHYPPQAFYEKDKKPTSIMVWGGIGPRGYRTQLIKFSENVNKVTYQEALQKNKIFENITSIFGNQWVWQQDGATPHSAYESMIYILQNVPHYLIWPAYSPDLSPIEQVWSYIKKRLAGQKFDDPDELFDAIEQEWQAVPAEVLHNIYSSFYARLVVCREIGGQSLNGHWTRVKQVHDQYRTKLVFTTDPISGQVMVSETK